MRQYLPVAQAGLSEEDKAVLDRVLAKISHRLTLERLSERMPAVSGLMAENKELIKLMMYLRVVFIQRNDFQLLVDEDGKNKYGQDKEEAVDEINSLLSQIDKAVARWL